MISERMVSVKILLFSVLKQKLGRESLDLTLQAPATGKDLLDCLTKEYAVIEAYRPVIRIAVNASYVPETTHISDGDEVALITPVSGG